jgi:hypothetical protein
VKWSGCKDGSHSDHFSCIYGLRSGTSSSTVIIGGGQGPPARLFSNQADFSLRSFWCRA